MRQPSNNFTSSSGTGRDPAATTQIRQAGVRTTDYCFWHIQGSDYNIVKQAFIDDLATMRQAESSEIILHPGYISEELRQSSSLVDERERDTQLATDSSIKDWLLLNYITLVSYSEIGA